MHTQSFLRGSGFLMSIAERRGGLRRELAVAFPDRHATEQSLRELLAHHSPASHTQSCCVVGAGSCSPLQRAAWGATAATKERGQPAVHHHPFPPLCSNKATPKIRASAAPPAPCPGPKETPQVHGTARKCLGSGRKRKSIEGSWSPRCPSLSMHKRFGKALGQAENKHTGPANPA